MRNVLRFLPVFVSPLLILLALAQGGWFVLSGAIFMFGCVPLLDAMLGLETENRVDGAWAPVLRALPMLFVPAHLITLALVLARVQQLGPTIEALGIVFAIGLGGAIAIVVAHELMHRSSWAEQRLAEVLMASTSYTHFCVEHVHGHHKRVATPDDPASAHQGESLYRFFPRTLLGSWRSAWAVEAQRAARNGRSTWGIHNRLVIYLLVQVALLAAVAGAWGPLGLAAFVGQSLVAVLLLETINYIEHYGLSRAETAPGKYERVRPEHSWNASHLVSNRMLLSLARHSDHHAFVQRPYSELRHWEGAPQLPFGYATMVLLALVPPLWFRVMDDRVDRWNETSGA